MPNSEIRDIREVPQGVERSLRLDIRLMLNRHDGTFVETNRQADELAMIILRNFNVEERS